jgi:hypothetical protein
MNTSKNKQFPDTEHNTPKLIPKQAREISAFFSLLVDETMIDMPDSLTPTWIRCFRKGCTGTISNSVDLDDNKLFWECSECKYSGTLIGFLGVFIRIYTIIYPAKIPAQRKNPL